MTDDRTPPLRPRLPMRGSGRSTQKNATFLALVGLLSAVLGLTVLITAVMTGFAPAAIVVIVLIMSAVAFLFGGHYLLWGVWLDRMLAARGESTRVDFWKQASLPPMPADVREEESDH